MPRLGPLGLPELLIILAVLLLIFGARRLPEIGSSLGKGIRMFKSSVTGEEDDKEAKQPAAEEPNPLQRASTNTPTESRNTANSARSNDDLV